MKSSLPQKKLTTGGSRFLIVIVFIAVALLILGLVISNEQWLAMNEQELSDQRSIRVPRELTDLLAREDSLLNSSELLDSATATYRIPIERAMELLEAEGSR